MTTKPMTRDEILEAMDSLAYHYVYDHTQTDELSKEIIKASCGLAECFINYLDAAGYQVVRKVADEGMYDNAQKAVFNYTLPNNKMTDVCWMKMPVVLLSKIFNAMCEQGRLK